MFINTHYQHPLYETSEMTEDEEEFSRQIARSSVPHYLSITFLALEFIFLAFMMEWEVLTFIYNVGSAVLIVLISCIALKIWNKRMDSLNETGLLDVCKRDYKIGYGGISMIIIGSHVALLAVEVNFYTYAYITWVAVYSIAILCFTFVLPSTYHSYISPHTDLPFYSHVFQFIYSLVLSISSHFLREDNLLLCDRRCKDFTPVICDRCEEFSMGDAITFVLIVSHALILLNSLYAMTFFYDVAFKDEVYLLSAQEVGQLSDRSNGRVAKKRMKKKKVIVVETSESEESDGEGGDQRSYNDLKCNVCLLKYSATSKNRSPRILTNCGHTVCFGCIKNLTARQKVVRCPFCKKRTNVPHGTVKKLPKNYAIIGLIGEMNEENKEAE